MVEGRNETQVYGVSLKGVGINVLVKKEVEAASFRGKTTSRAFQNKKSISIFFNRTEAEDFVSLLQSNAEKVIRTRAMERKPSQKIMGFDLAFHPEVTKRNGMAGKDKSLRHCLHGANKDALQMRLQTGSCGKILRKSLIAHHIKESL